MTTTNIIGFILIAISIVVQVGSFVLTHSHPLRSGILALCNKRWLEVFLRNRVEFTAVFELTLDLLNYGLSPFVQQFQ